ncbi:DUF2512 family protein [Gracilibacillus massiliensis]|uniref:DUF2512 family protein n=1 Tax=Gracilibacillus massiliensis TaxID=1564956 RepID=UPI00071D5EC2|nr:DUF2512 family protein [Gracilibacillus massiliensis]
MNSLIVKLVHVPLVLFIAINVSNHIQYEIVWQPVFIILLLIGSGLLLEYIVLKNNLFWFSVILDFLASFIILYFISNMLEGAYISFVVSLVLSAILTLVEYFLHRYLFKSRHVN